MTETGTFPEGIITESGVVRKFTLEEQKYRHTLVVMNGPDAQRCAEDPAFFTAAILAQRLTIPGVTVTAELVNDLSALDGQELTAAGIRLEMRRRAFRDAAGAAPQDAGGPAETGA